MKITGSNILLTEAVDESINARESLLHASLCTKVYDVSTSQHHGDDP